LLSADEAFFTGTAAEVTPICQITDGSRKDQAPADWKKHSIGSGKPGPITRKLSQKYAEVVRGKDPAYDKWLSYVYSSPEEAEKNLENKEPEYVTKY
jgi:branched-chain amino acid aminotransferase